MIFIMENMLDFLKLLIEAGVAIYILVIFAFTIIPAITTSSSQNPFVFWVLIIVAFFSIIAVVITQFQKVFL